MDIANSSSAGLDHPQRLTRRAWHTRAVVPMACWIVASVVMVNIHRFVPRSTWMLVHFMTLGVASNAIVVWSNHFADAVLRTGNRGRRREVVELALLNTALVLLTVGVVGQYAVPVWLGAAALAGPALAVKTFADFDAACAARDPERWMSGIWSRPSTKAESASTR